MNQHHFFLKEEPGTYPILQLWSQPRVALRALLDLPWASLAWLIPLAAVAGIEDVFETQIKNAMGDYESLSGLVIVAVLLGPFWGVLNWLLESWLFYLAGKWFKGYPEWRNLLTGVAWSKLPLALVVAVFWIPAILLFGNSMFQTDAEFNLIQNVIAAFFVILYFAILIWHFFIISQILAELNGFSSAWKGFGFYLLGKLMQWCVLAIVYLPFSLL